MVLSERLKAVADEVLYDTIADIGTDHGYLPIFLLKSGKIKKAVACDINEGPLLKAGENIKKNSLDGFIELRLCGGLSGLNDGEAQTVVISGMGGILICSILDEGREKLENIKQLVLQPQRDADIVRKKIHELGFKITDEKMIYDGGKYYNVINAEKGNEKYESERDYFFGRLLLEKRPAVFLSYIKNRADKYENALKAVSFDNADTEKLKALLKAYREVLYGNGKDN